MTDEKQSWINAQGHSVPDAMVSDMDRIIEETLREIARHCFEAMNRVARLRGHCIDDLVALNELLGEKYGVRRGGKKGNLSFLSFDGKLKAEIRVQDRVVFGPELQVAKALLTQYIEEQSNGVPPAIMALVNHAFEVDKQGNVNRGQLYSLRRMQLPEPNATWDRAMDAIGDSMRVVGSKEYFQLSVADKHGNLRALPINLSNAYETEG